MAAPYEENDANFLRFARIVFDFLPDIMRDLLTTIHDPAIPINLIGLKPKLTRNQKSVIDEIPLVGDYSKCELSLLVTLVRYLGRRTNTKRPPKETDISVGDDVSRISDIRNLFAHNVNNKLDDVIFKKYVEMVASIANRFDNCHNGAYPLLKGSGTYQKRLESILLVGTEKENCLGIKICRVLEDLDMNKDEDAEDNLDMNKDEDAEDSSSLDIFIKEKALRYPDDHLTKLGRGSYGDVYMYKDELCNLSVAIKRMKIDGGLSTVKSVENEIQLHGRLRHKNIAQYLGSYKMEHSFFIILEYAERGSLRNKLEVIQSKQEINENQPVISNDDIMKYTSHVVSGLAYLHSKRVIHRDLRAANILLSANDTAKIADFGISKQLADLFSTKFTTMDIGNPFWRSPELMRSKKEDCGRKVDVWSLGITILEMIYVKPPFMNANHFTYMFGLLEKNEVPEIPDFVRQDVKEILKKCLVYDVISRPYVDGLGFE